MVRPEKVKEVELLTVKLSEANSVVLVNFRGINVEQVQDLREQCREEHVEYRVVKNTLLKLALDEVGMDGMLDDMLEGPTALALSYDDPVAPAQKIKSFSEEHDVLEIKGGIFDGTVIDAEEVSKLADLPPREDLLTQVACCFAGPLNRVAQVLQAPMRDLALTTSEIHKRAG